jgi:transcriptional regulator with XRE-family HTH domain
MQIKSELFFMENTFGHNLRKIRTDRNLTLSQLAEKLGVKHQSVEKWEKGITMPNGKRLIELVTILEISQNDLYQEYSEKSKFEILYELEKQKVSQLQEELIKYQAAKIEILQEANS